MLSVIIPHVPSPPLDQLLDRCRESLSGYGELVLIINDGIGYGASFNRGFQFAKGDYLVAVSNDTVLTGGSLQDLCIPDTVTYSENAQWGCFFCLPRSVYEQIGGFDEQFKGAYFEDNDYLHRLGQANIPVKRVEGVSVHHEGGATVREIMSEGELFRDNQQRFYDKWSFYP